MRFRLFVWMKPAILVWVSLGAGEHVIFHVFHKGQGAGVLDHFGHPHNAADVDAAVAHKDTDARRVARHIARRRDGLFCTRVLRAEASLDEAALAAALASMMEVGMSLGPVKTPQA